MRRTDMLRAVCVVMVAGMAACGGGGVSDTGTGPGPTPPVDTTKPPTVQRASITTRVTIDPADAAIASVAGVTTGGIIVRLTRAASGFTPQTAVTAADGTVRFDNLLEGLYSVSVDRTLTAAELARLSPGDRDASVFAGGAQVVLSPPANQALDVAIVGARRGSVVISEIFANYGPTSSGTNNYVYGSYIELYNNGDTTAYLDGMVLFRTSPTAHSRTLDDPGRCEQLPNTLRLDTTAVHSGIIYGFPGTGTDYPIRPGEAKVVAMDAINHIVAAPEKEQVDLSRAHFEQFWTDADVDNPEAVNMVRVYGSSAGVFGRGFASFSNGLQLLVSRAGRDQLTEVSVPNTSGGTFTTARLPSQHILDVVALEYSPLTPGYEVAQQLFPRCVPWASSFYDRAPAPLMDSRLRKSISRRSLGRTSDGREILQRTRNSERDFFLADPLQRSLNR